MIGDDNPRCSTVFTFEPHQLSFHHPYNTSESAFQEIIGDLEEQKVNVVDDYLRTILHRVKKEAELSEVEYGKLIMMIECGQLVGVCDMLEECLETFDLVLLSNRNDFKKVYKAINHQSSFTFDKKPSLSSSNLLIPLTITDIGIEYSILIVNNIAIFLQFSFIVICYVVTVL